MGKIEERKVMMKIYVKVDCIAYHFDCIEEAVAFAETVALHAKNEKRVVLTIIFTKEESAENGED